MVVPEESPSKLEDISAGSRHTFSIETGGRAYVQGFVESEFGYLGHMGLGPVMSTKKCKNPNKEFCVGSVGGDDPFLIEYVMDASGKQVFAPLFKRAFAGVGVPADSGPMHAVLISRDGRVYISGNNNDYQLCLGEEYNDVEYVDYFHEVPGISNAVMAAVGDGFTLILTSDNQVYGCGSNSVGQIGQGLDVDYSNVPVLIQGLGKVDSMSAGLRFAIFLDSSKGEVWASGSNIYGQQCYFTDGEPTNNVAPVRVFLDGENVFSVVFIGDTAFDVLSGKSQGQP